MSKKAMLLCAMSALLLGALAPSGALADSEAENSDSVEMVIALLNNQQDCQLPAYEELNELQLSLDELEAQRGGLSDDQKLVRETVLDSWDSFPWYPNSENLSVEAKRRALLGKVARYQEAKFGMSICKKQRDTEVLDDSETENSDFVEMVIALLNNQQDCQLPAYEELDELQLRLDKLEAQRGGLSDDQKLVRETVLDQWDSFQKYLNSENVLKAAKRRAFLGKVERYQEAKFGMSICTKQPDTEVPNGSEYEKNPLVRYVKAMGGQATGENSESAGNGQTGNPSVPSGSADADGSDVELKFKVHTRDESGKITSSKQIAGKFNFDESRPQHRITLHLGGNRR